MLIILCGGHCLGSSLLSLVLTFLAGMLCALDVHDKDSFETHQVLFFNSSVAWRSSRGCFVGSLWECAGLGAVAARFCCVP